MTTTRSAGVSEELEPHGRSAKKRRAILEAATEVFLQKGYLATNMDEIAALASSVGCVWASHGQGAGCCVTSRFRSRRSFDGTPRPAYGCSLRHTASEARHGEASTASRRERGPR